MVVERVGSALLNSTPQRMKASARLLADEAPWLEWRDYDAA
jgi:hypothetical protein